MTLRKISRQHWQRLKMQLNTQSLLTFCLDSNAGITKIILEDRKKVMEASAIILNDKIVGIAAHCSYQCCGNARHSVEITPPVNKKVKYNIMKSCDRDRAIDYDLNVMAMINQFQTGTGPSCTSRTCLLLDLPNAINFANNTHRYKGLIGSHI